MLQFLWFTILWNSVWLQTDYVPPNYEAITTKPLEGFGSFDACDEGERQGRFLCVPYYQCDPDTNSIIATELPTNVKPPQNYSFLIDIRFGEPKLCTESVAVCCKKQADNGTTVTSTEAPMITPTSNPVITPEPTIEPSLASSCGIRNENGIDFKIIANQNEAEYGEFPWMAAVLRRNFDPTIHPCIAICGGSLISPNVVLTGAHCVYNLDPQDLKIRVGEWDTQTTKERYPFQEQNVIQIIKHNNFHTTALFNDIALLILENPIKYDKHIGTICLPEHDEVINSTECYATGWGKNLFGRQGEYQVILKKIDLPIVDSNTCEKELQKTRLGHRFQLDDTFICAGGIPNKDTCTGDGGSPLVCPDPNNPRRFIQAGVVAWGIGCGTQTPGVYANVAQFRKWIDNQIKNLSFETYTL